MFKKDLIVFTGLCMAWITQTQNAETRIGQLMNGTIGLDLPERFSQVILNLKEMYLKAIPNPCDSPTPVPTDFVTGRAGSGSDSKGAPRGTRSFYHHATICCSFLCFLRPAYNDSETLKTN